MELALTNSGSAYAIRMRSVELLFSGPGGEAVDAADIVATERSGIYEQSERVALVRGEGNRLVAEFSGFVLEPGESRTVTVRLAVKPAVAGFRVQLLAGSLSAVYAEGPLAGEPVEVVDADRLPVVLAQEFVATGAGLEESFTIQQNPFNPFDSAAVFAYRLEQAGAVEFRIFSLSGELVYSQVFPAGAPETEPNVQHLIRWDGRNDDGVMVLNGVYVAMIRQPSTGRSATLRVAVMK